MFSKFFSVPSQNQIHCRRSFVASEESRNVMNSFYSEDPLVLAIWVLVFQICFD